MNEILSNNEYSDTEIISFYLGEQIFSVNIMSVREIRGWTKATPLAHAPHYVLGVINLRGTVIPVINMALRLGLDATPETERSAIIVANIQGQLVGLLVDNVSDMVTVTEEEIQNVPEVGSAELQRMTTAIITKEKSMISHLDLDLLLDEEIELAA